MLAFSLGCADLFTLTTRLLSSIAALSASRFPALLVSSICLLGISACSHEDNPGNKEIVLQQSSEFDADSWKTVIPDSCSRFFDGCNQCRRTPGSVLATCTRKACARYLEPKCLDEKMDATVAVESMRPKREDYLCDGNNQFSIYYGTYLTEEQRLKLSSEEVMLADRQTLSAYKLTKKTLGSVVVFSDGKFALQSLGDEVQITLENDLLYTNCKIRKPPQ